MLLRRLGIALVLMLLAGSPAHALNLTLGDVRANNLGSHGFTATNSVLSFDSGRTDQLYQLYGHLGNAFDTVAVSATYFSVASAIVQTAPGVARSSLLLNAAGASALGIPAGTLRLDYTFTLVDDTSPADLDSFLWDVSFTNLGRTQLALSMYQYLDLDLNGTAGNDRVSASRSRMIVSDATAPFTFQWLAANGGQAGHFAVQGYPNVRSLLDGMAAATNLPDAAGSFGPGDFTGAFQYDFVLPAGGRYDLVGGAVVVPEPAPILLALLGLAGLAAATRRRRRRLPGPARPGRRRYRRS